MMANGSATDNAAQNMLIEGQGSTANATQNAL